MSKTERAEQAVAFVVARLGSSRFPGKHFRHIGERPLIQLIIDQLRACRQLDKIVLATVARSENEPLRQFALIAKLPCFCYEGEVDHVTTRLRKAAEKFAADICILVSGDCPLVYAPAIDQLISQLKSDPAADFVRIPPDASGLPHALEGISIARKRAWQLADDISDRPELKEHHFPVIAMRPELFKAKDCTLPSYLYAPHHRLSVDTWADLEFMREVFAELSAMNRHFNLPEVLRLLQEKKELLEINGHVRQRRLVENIKRALFVVDVGPEFGYGHFTRSVELALQMVERLGWPVTFLVDDERAATILEDYGLMVAWGSLERQTKLPANKRTVVETHNIIAQYDLFLLDIYWQRKLASGWRDRLSTSSAAVVIVNRLDAWAREADQVIIPELISSADRESGALGGLEFVILRRAIRRASKVSKAGSPASRKDIDFLAYLHLAEQRQSIARLADRLRKKFVIINGFDENFPELLARSRFFVSGFGYSFYEALFLGAIPIAWPLTVEHARAASFFYESMGMNSLITHDGDIESFLCDNNLLPLENPISDGTPRIVSFLEDMLHTG